MRHTILRALAALVVTTSVIGQGRAETPADPSADKAAIERIVRDYLLRNPEVIDEALGVLQARRQAEEQARVRVAVTENREALGAHPMSPVSGNADGDVTVVEFFDYQCGYCKRALKTMEDLLETDANVRVVWKEFPILGPVSVVAARTAMAAQRQGRYLALHLALMREPELTEQKVFDIAEQTGLDMAQLRRDMEDGKRSGHRGLSRRSPGARSAAPHRGHARLCGRRHAGSGRRRRCPDEGARRRGPLGRRARVSDELPAAAPRADTRCGSWPCSRSDCANSANVAAARSVSACRLSPGRSRSGSTIAHLSFSRLAASAISSSVNS